MEEGAPDLVRTTCFLVESSKSSRLCSTVRKKTVIYYRLHAFFRRCITEPPSAGFLFIAPRTTKVELTHHLYLQTTRPSRDQFASLLRQSSISILFHDDEGSSTTSARRSHHHRSSLPSLVPYGRSSLLCPRLQQIQTSHTSSARRHRAICFSCSSCLWSTWHSAH